MDRQTLQSKQQQQQQQPKQQPSLQTASQPQHLNISLGSAGHAPYGHRHHPYQQANQLGTASAAPAEPFKVDQQTFEKSLNEVYQFKQCISVKIKQLESSITRLKSLVFVPAESSASETSAASSSSISTEHSSMAGDQRGSEENFYEVLRTGALLCKLLNTISEGAVKKYNPNTTMAFKCMDNINSFLLGLDAIGVPVEDRFQTVDLWEQVNLHSVQICLQAMGRKAPKFGVKGFGPKEANENRRTFTEEQLKQGETIINLQMGSNKGASQSGMTFGKSTRF